jgi:hypothetical protein
MRDNIPVDGGEKPRSVQQYSVCGASRTLDRKKMTSFKEFYLREQWSQPRVQ